MKQKVLALMLGLVLLMTAIPANAESGELVGPSVALATPTDLVVPAEPAEEATEPEVEEAEAIEPAPETESRPAEEPAAPEEPAVAEEPEAEIVEETARASAYERGADGALILDASGNPIPILPADATEKPVAWQRDGNGALVLDKWGEPIPTQFVNIEAEKIATIEDVLNPGRRIDIYADWGGGALYFGAEAKLTAVLQGYDNVVYTLQWETSRWDGLEEFREEKLVWKAVPGANDPEYTLTVTEENYLDFWRVKVTVTAVEQEAA